MVVASGEIHLPRFLRREAGAEVDRLYRRHADEVFRYALMVMRSRPDAEDIVQIVFLRALRAIERGEKVRTPRNWLIKIAHNECRRMLSSRKAHVELPEEIAVEPVERGRADELRAAMAALPETQRQALVLRELEGRTYVEIATALGLTVSAVETLIFRARRTLREQIEASLSCEEFALLLDDPDARSRIRAHARVCPACATLERQTRGRKSALKRIASMVGIPWWGAKLVALGLTAATVAAVASAPHHHQPRNLVPRGGSRSPSFTSPTIAPRPVAAPVSGAHRVSDTGPVSPPRPRPVTTVRVTQLPSPRNPKPVESHAPPPAAAWPPTPALPPAVTIPAVTTLTMPAVAVPAPTIPAVTVPITVQAPILPAVTAPVETNVNLP